MTKVTFPWTWEKKKQFPVDLERIGTAGRSTILSEEGGGNETDELFRWFVFLKCDPGSQNKAGGGGGEQEQRTEILYSWHLIPSTFQVRITCFLIFIILLAVFVFLNVISAWSNSGAISLLCMVSPFLSTSLCPSVSFLRCKVNKEIIDQVGLLWPQSPLSWKSRESLWWWAFV